MAQFSVKIMRLTGSVLGENQQRDLPEPFLVSLQDGLRGEYSKAYDDVASPPGGFVVPRPSSEWDKVDLRVVRSARRSNGMRALMRACGEHGAPFQVKTLACNGQAIVVGQVGQLLIMTEPIDSLLSRPDQAAYKADLAASHFSIRQLEMDLGDGWRQRIDARNTILVVVQHGMRIGGFNRRDTALEMMRVVVPDASFGSWLIKTNVMNGELSAMLDWTTFDKTNTARPTQEDRVVVTLKKNLGERGEPFDKEMPLERPRMLRRAVEAIESGSEFLLEQARQRLSLPRIGEIEIFGRPLAASGSNVVQLKPVEINCKRRLNPTFLPWS